MDRAFTTVTRSRRLRAIAPPDPDLALIPIYALALPLYEPVHGAIRAKPIPLRAALYGFGFIATEYAVGAALRRIGARPPWDYGDARWSIDGLTRLDYLPLWALAGLALEPLHDRLTGRVPSRARC